MCQLTSIPVGDALLVSLDAATWNAAKHSLILDSNVSVDFGFNHHSLTYWCKQMAHCQHAKAASWGLPVFVLAAPLSQHPSRSGHTPHHFHQTSEQQNSIHLQILHLGVFIVSVIILLWLA